MTCAPSSGCAECSVLCNATWYESYNYSSYGYTYDEHGEIVLNEASLIVTPSEVVASARAVVRQSFDRSASFNRQRRARTDVHLACQRVSRIRFQSRRCLDLVAQLHPQRTIPRKPARRVQVRQAAQPQVIPEGSFERGRGEEVVA